MIAGIFRQEGTLRLRSGWRLLLFAFLSALCIAFLGWALVPRPLRPGVEWPLYLTDIGGTLLATWVCLRLENLPWGDVGLRIGARWARHLGLGFLLGCLVMLLGTLALWIAGGVHWAPRPGGGLRAMASGFGLYLLVALSEELTFRGYGFQRLLEGLGPWGAQLLGGLWFAWAHWSNPGMTHPVQKAWATLNITLAAVFLGYAYLRTRSLALPIGLHLGWNWMQGSVLGFAVSGTTDDLGPWIAVVDLRRAPWFNGGTFGLEASVFGTGACLATLLALAFLKDLSDDPSTGEAR